METAPLKAFATRARTELLREVNARITAVLAQSSQERVEQPSAMNALERAIADAGGGDKGKAHVADKVAYTWFNRIIALRFMDANGYTGIGVVSPAADQVGQPEVLAAAKRGQIDKDVVKGTSPATIAGLLNGTLQPRLGVDAQAEAYELLLADYCHFWNAAMPFMFEREGDYTELLTPANLLSDDSLLSRSVTVLTEDVCQDVEVIGWLYQFYIAERKDQVFAGFKKNKKAGADEIPAATQLFTPHWIVRYLVENSLGRLWMLNRPSSGLASQMDYYIAPVGEETDFLKISMPEEIKVIDPACGSGHMLTYAFDLLYAIYEEEGYAPSEIPGLILTNNLYGTEIDPRAGALAAFALTMKAVAKRKLFLKNPVEPNICVLDPITFSPDELDYLVTKDGDRHAEEAFWNQFAEADTFGSLIAPDPLMAARLARHLESLDDNGDMYKADALHWAHVALEQAMYLLPRYSVVVANPPYMGSGTMGARLFEYAKASHPASKSDLFAMFIERGLDLVSSRGFVAMVTMQSWMFLSSYEKLRKRILSSARITSMFHLGTRAFDSIGGEVVSTTAFVIERKIAPGALGAYVRATDGNSEAEKRAAFVKAHAARTAEMGWYSASSTDFAKVPGSPIAYWLSNPMRAAFAKEQPLRELADAQLGMRTGDNGKYLRQWWEVSHSATTFGARSAAEASQVGKRWVTYNKGGQYRKWSGNRDYVVLWENDGHAIKEETLQKYPQLSWDNLGWKISNERSFFRPSVSWSKVTAGEPAFREYDEGFIFDVAGTSFFPKTELHRRVMMGVCNSSAVVAFLQALAPTMNFEVGTIAALPVILPDDQSGHSSLVDELVQAARSDWDSFETSWSFASNPLVGDRSATLGSIAEAYSADLASRSRDQMARETANNRIVAGAYGLGGEVPIDVPLHRVSLTRNVEFRYGPGLAPKEYTDRERADMVVEVVSYAVGCMFGRYSLDEPGLVLADQGATLADYLTRVPTPSFSPDTDNVIPIVDGDWFEDDVVGLFRRFLRTAFGDQHFDENLNFVTESLGVKNLRDYFITRAGKSKFYDDHVQRYKKRPIYWLFSSPKGSFNALIYMHRYRPSTVSTVLTYLREYVTKLESSLQQSERAGNAKEADRLRKILVELNEYERDTLYPKASENAVIDLDDGVKANYPKLGAALKKIPGLEVSDD